VTGVQTCALPISTYAGVMKPIYGVCSCDPLSLVFGPFKLWRIASNPDPNCCLCCEAFYVTVTL